MLRSEGEQVDIIAAIAFLHHVRDYLGLIDQAIPLLTSTGHFLSFPDPLRYDSVSRFTRLVTNKRSSPRWAGSSSMACSRTSARFEGVSPGLPDNSSCSIIDKANDVMPDLLVLACGKDEFEGEREALFGE